MKTNLPKAMLAIALLCIASSASAGLAGSRYSITVKVSDGITVFHECLAFESDGTLTMQSRFQPMVWAQTTNPFSADTFSASHPGGVIFRSGYGLALHGYLDARGVLIGNAINEHGTTFTFRGIERIGCTNTKDHDYFSMVAGSAEEAEQEASATKAQAIGGQELLVAQRTSTYQVAYFADEWHQDCWHFSPQGQVWADSGFDLIWRTEKSGTHSLGFESTGPQTFGASYAINGRFSGNGGITVSGLVSTTDRTVPLYGFGHFDQGCVRD